jgi:hypothetical protein
MLEQKATVPNPSRSDSGQTSPFVLCAVAAALLAAGYVLVVRPNASYIQIFLDDVIGLTDAAYRTYAGRVPSVDFRSLYGAAAYYPAALGFHLGFAPGAVLAFGQFVVSAFLLLAAALAAARRLSLPPAVFMLMFIALLVLVPHRPGGAPGDLSFAIFYTRLGWAALAIALLFYLEPRRPGPRDLVLDSAILTSLLLYLFYLKITFGALAIAFVIANGVTSRYKRRLALTSVGAFVAIFITIQIFTPYNSAYFDDIFGVAEKTPAMRHSSAEYARLVLDHSWIFVLCLTALATAWMAGRRNIFDLAFAAGAIVGCVAVLEYSGGIEREMPPLVVVLLVLGELARRDGAFAAGGSLRRGGVASLAVFGMALAVAAPPMLNATAALYLYSSKLARAQAAAEDNLAGIYVPPPPDRPASESHESMAHDEASHDRFAQARPSALQLQSWEYLPLILEGIELLESVPHDNHAVVTFEQTNPFGFALGMRPTRYGYPLNFVSSRVIERSRQPAARNDRLDPERFFSDADYVMVPEVPFKRIQLEGMLEIHGAYLEKHFYELKRSPHWRLYARR